MANGADISPADDHKCRPLHFNPPGFLSNRRNTYQPPQDEGAERRALSALMRGGRTTRYKFAEALRAEMFTRQREAVAEAAIQLVEDGSRPDLETLRGRLETDGQREEAEACRQIQCTPTNMPLFIDAVRAAYMLRQQIRAGETLVGAALEANPSSLEDAEAAQENAEKQVLDLSSKVLASRGAMHFSEIAGACVEDIMEGGRKSLTGVTTGFRVLDKLTGGWQDGTLVVLAARPGMGKSALMGNMAVAAALGRAGVKVNGSYDVAPTPAAILSLEMPGKRLGRRMIAAEAKINQRNLDPHEGTERKLKRAAERIAQAPLYIEDTGGINIREMGATLRRMKSEHDIGVAFVDFLQRMTAPRHLEGATPNVIVGHNARRTADLAKELGIPIIMLCQLNRSVERQSGPPRPALPHLRDSGEIEDSADVVAFLYRPEEYGITVDPNTGENVKGIAEVILAKHREGEQATRRLAYKKQYTLFADLDTGRTPEPQQPTPSSVPRPNDNAPF